MKDIKNNINVANALKVLVNALTTDKDYYNTWKANIAVEYNKEFSRQLPFDSDLPSYEISNAAADNFLRLLCDLPPNEVLRVGTDMICPVTNQHCDDECCTPGSECNISGNNLNDMEP